MQESPELVRQFNADRAAQTRAWWKRNWQWVAVLCLPLALQGAVQITYQSAVLQAQQPGSVVIHPALTKLTAGMRNPQHVLQWAVAALSWLNLTATALLALDHVRALAPSGQLAALTDPALLWKRLQTARSYSVTGWLFYFYFCGAFLLGALALALQSPFAVMIGLLGGLGMALSGALPFGLTVPPLLLALSFAPLTRRQSVLVIPLAMLLGLYLSTWLLLPGKWFCETLAQWLNLAGGGWRFGFLAVYCIAIWTAYLLALHHYTQRQFRHLPQQFTR